MMYRVVIERQAEKALAKIQEPDYSKIKTAIFSLAIEKMFMTEPVKIIK